MARSTRTRSANEPSSEHCLFLVRSGNHTYPLARDHSRKNALEIAAGEHCYATTTGIRGEGKDMGEHDARFIDTLSDVAEKVADSISHKLHPMVEQYAKLFKTGICTPVLKRPSDIGLDYEDVFFPSLDGIPLEAWFIPADSDKLLIVNHPMTCNRYGFRGHLPPWNTMFGGFEVKTSCRS